MSDGCASVNKQLEQTDNYLTYVFCTEDFDMSRYREYIYFFIM